MRFRGSGAGYCSRQIITQVLHPELTKMPEAKRPFLDAGHYLQEAVEEFLMKHLPAPWGLLRDWRESEGIHRIHDLFTIVGHVDGVLAHEDKTYLLEVKAIKNKSFNKLLKLDDWREMYGNYQYQAQTYLNFPGLERRGEVLAEEFLGTHFVYYNRDTSDMLTSLPIVHEAVTVRSDMYEPKSTEFFAHIVEKYRACYEAILDETVPSTCDMAGYCWFCGKVGGTPKTTKKRRRVCLEGCDPEQAEILFDYESIKGLEKGILHYFNEFKADDIILESGEELKREDYE